MSNNSAPYEIIASPATFWIAPVGTAFPDTDTAPSGSWTKVGTSGDRSYGEDGVTIEHPQTMAVFRSLGSTGPRKAFRSAEELFISLMLADLSLEQYAAVISQSVTTVAAGVGTPGYKKIGLMRGLTVLQKALLVRGPSPYDDAMAMQFEVPVAVQIGEPQTVFRKDTPAMLAVKWQALEDPNASSEVERFGRLVAQTADALT